MPLQAEQPNDPRVICPVAPADPPSTADMMEARSFKEDVLLSSTLSGDDRANSVVVAKAMMYEHAVTHLAAMPVLGIDPNQVPPWFTPFKLQLDRLEIKMAQVLLNTNTSGGDGDIYPYEIVSFENGENPTLPPHNLPALTNAGDVEGLIGPQASKYLAGYGYAPIHSIAECRKQIKEHIGCR